MATPSVKGILRLPGDLISNPSDLALSSPHGGTNLGLIRAVTFRPTIKTKPLTAMEYGNITVDAIYAGEGAVLVAVLRPGDNDSLNAVFPNTTAGTDGDRNIDGRVSGAVVRPGTLLSTKSISLLLTPKAERTAPALLIYKAIPALEETAELQGNIATEAGWACVFYCIPDATGRVYSFGKLDDLTI